MVPVVVWIRDVPIGSWSPVGDVVWGGYGTSRRWSFAGGSHWGWALKFYSLFPLPVRPHSFSHPCLPVPHPSLSPPPLLSTSVCPYKAVNHFPDPASTPGLPHHDGLSPSGSTSENKILSSFSCFWSWYLITATEERETKRKPNHQFKGAKKKPKIPPKSTGVASHFLKGES